jgi:hypothetical protein
MVAHYDRVVPPGRQGAVTATINTLGLYGDKRKRITVTTNDPENPTIDLEVRLQIRHPVEVSPGDNLVLPFRPTGEPAQELTLRRHDRQSLEVSRVEVRVPWPRVEELSRHSDGRPWLRGGPERFYRVSLDSGIPEGGLETTVSFHTNHPRRPLVDVRVTARGRDAMRISPPRVYFGAVKPVMDPPVSRLVRLHAAEGFRVLSAGSSDPCVGVRYERTTMSAWEVTLKYTRGWRPGRMTGRIWVTTDNPKHPRVEIPFQAEVSE